MTKPNLTPAIAIHGGAGTIARDSLSPEQEKLYHAGLAGAVRAGQRVLEQGGAALDAVTEAVVALEDYPLFNAGHGAVYTRDGKHELDASIMDGRTLATGAVGFLRRIRNPIRAARAVMERSEYVFMVGEGADAFALEQGLAEVENSYFDTVGRHEQWLLVRAEGGVALDHDAASRLAARTKASVDGRKFGTVGAVAIDRDGNLAAGTSTGGMTNKHSGRIGDSPLIGAGCYANNRTVAISATGTGEVFVRTVAAHDISARMEYAGASLAEACQQVIMEKLPPLGGRGGIVAIDHLGNVLLPFNTEGMYRGWARGSETPITGIYA
jgi:beta-aspartyl-peptidase (threonine type)